MNRPLILIVEDNPIQQRLLRLLTASAGLEPHVVASGEEALKALDVFFDDRFALILMDVRMNDMDGLECTRLIRNREIHTGRHIPIIAITANAMTGDRQHCLDAGMDDYLSKPFSLDQFAKMIAFWLEKSLIPADVQEQLPPV